MTIYKHIDKLKIAFHGVIALSVLTLAGCSNSLDLRAQHKDQREERLNYSAQASSMALSDAASALRYLNNQNSSQNTNSQSLLQVSDNQKVAHAIPAPQVVAYFAGRYTGQIPCHVQSSQCAQEKIDIALTLLPDGSAIRTLVQQGKVNAMLEKETAVWTVTGNGQHIMLILPNHEVWSFRRAGQGKLRFEPESSATLTNAVSTGSREYVLTAANI